MAGLAVRLPALGLVPRNTCATPPAIRGRSVTCRAANLKDAPALGSVANDGNVPEAHKGLHGFLYGAGGAEEHDTADMGYAVRMGEDDGSVLMPVPWWLSSREGDKPLGVYCLYDAAGALQYVGYARNMCLAVKAHLTRVGVEHCASIRTKVFANKAMASRTHMEREVQSLIQEHVQRSGKLPPGNGDEREVWEGSVDVSVMTPEQREAYETKKNKLRKAMGEDVLGGQGQKEDDAATRRLKTIAALEKGDWSAEIDGQTMETTSASADTSPTDTPVEGQQQKQPPQQAALQLQQGTVVSPFTDGRGDAAVNKSAAAAAASGSPGAAQQQQPAIMSVESVQAALEEVRPYLMADGGDVDVVSVEGGVVALSLQGACSTCASSSATMKHGIERVLKNTFGDQLKEVVQVDGGQEAAKVTVAMVDMQLNMLRGAIRNFGGAVEVVSVEEGRVELRYIGPPALGKGLAAAVKDTFAPQIKEVVFVD